MNLSVSLLLLQIAEMVENRISSVGCKVSVVVRTSSAFTVAFCKGSCAALETQTGKAQGCERAASGLWPGTGTVSSADISLAASKRCLFSRAGWIVLPEALSCWDLPTAREDTRH